MLEVVGLVILYRNLARIGKFALLVVFQGEDRIPFGCSSIHGPHQFFKIKNHRSNYAKIIVC